ncbi:alpha/beta hydrolase [Hoyosella altamirensis]|uniref:Acetyl esterase/lipase n=1 Tax=Hoyosella altamirensis TaxID=616997 RepID=A0A839RKD7_9ACTN|nr:alpha/beta hydrolase [Hoyosella altamirensis]MBB3036920.1 acetyl esterase/lipase [Hoyosella altamirensis]
MTLARQMMRLVVRGVVRPTLSPSIPVGVQRAVLDIAGRVAKMPQGTQVNRISLYGCPAERVKTPAADAHRAVLYLHGGGYTVGSPRTHRALAAHLSAAARMPVYLADYRLAPEHPYPAALEDAINAYKALLQRGIVPGRIAIAGDSAGAGLALALCTTLRDGGIPAPAGIALMSPWVDLTLTGVRDDNRDPMLRTAWLRSCAARYGGVTESLTNPALSPMYADLSGLPPMLVHAGSDEILGPDIDRFVEHVRNAGGAIRQRIFPGLWHVAHLHAGLVAECTDATEEVGHFIGSATTRSTSDVYHF